MSPGARVRAAYLLTTAQLQERKLLLIHPNTRVRAAVFAHLLATRGQSQILYYRVPRKTATFTAFLHDLCSDSSTGSRFPDHPVSSVTSSITSGITSSIISPAAPPSNGLFPRVRALLAANGQDAARASSGVLAEAWADDLNTQVWRNGQYRPLLLVLDDMDHLRPPAREVAAFMRTLVERMGVSPTRTEEDGTTTPEGELRRQPVQIALYARRLDFEPWYPLVRERAAIVIDLDTEGKSLVAPESMFTPQLIHAPDGNTQTQESKSVRRSATSSARKAAARTPRTGREDLPLEPADATRPRLEVSAFGRGHAQVNGRTLNNWDGALPRHLFFFLVDRPILTRDEFFSAFWPRLSTREATNVFHVTKRKIAERLSAAVGDGKNYDLTRYQNGYYLPADTLIRRYDVLEFQEAAETGLSAADEQTQIEALERAACLYCGPFLQDMEMEWAQERRAALLEQLLDVLMTLGQLHRQRSGAMTGLRWFMRAAREMPTHAEAHREVIACYLQLGRADDARGYEQRFGNLT